MSRPQPDRPSSGPPWLARALLHLSVEDPDVREGLLGDLQEEDERPARRGAFANGPRWAWYGLRVLGLSARFLIERLPGGLGAGSRPPAEGIGKGRTRLIESLLQDLHFAIRSLRRRPGFTVAAVLTLALGIGANAAMFGVIKTVILGPLPFASPDRVVQVWDLRPNQQRGIEGRISLPNFRDYERLHESFSHFAGMATGGLYVSRDDRATSVTGLYVSADLFNIMDVVPAAGRVFQAEEDFEGVGDVVMISHAYWLREFGGEDVIGRTLPLRRWTVPLGEDGTFRGIWPRVQHEIIGVLPPGFRAPPMQVRNQYGAVTENEDIDVLLPLGLFMWQNWERSFSTMRTLAELRVGVSVDQAQDNLQAIADGIAESDPVQTGIEVTVVPAATLARQHYGMALGLLWGATALVLLVACAGVSSLLLGWSVAREQELAVRTALGAGARRLFRQLLTEAAVIAGASGLLGVLLGYWGIAVLKILTPAGVYRLPEVGLDLGVLAFTMGVAIVTVLLVGLWPAARGATGPSSEVLKAGGRGATLSRARSLRALVTTEIALSLVLLAGAGLMLKSLWNLVRVDTGVTPEGVFTVTIQEPPDSRYQGYEGKLQLYYLLKDRVLTIPGVTGFARGGSFVLSGRGEPSCCAITMIDRPRPPEGQRFFSAPTLVSPGFFQVLGVQLLEGRTFDDSEVEETDPDDLSLGPMPRVINAAMARKFWPDESAVGKIFFGGDHDPAVLTASLGAGQPSGESGMFRGSRVIGVVSDIHVSLETVPAPVYFRPGPGGNTVYIRTLSDVAGMADVLRREVEAIDPSNIEVTRITTLDRIAAELTADDKFQALLVVFFAMMATGITCLGLFGVLTYAMHQRTREIGIRVTLGAARADIAGLVLGQGARMAGIGVAIGLVLVLWMTRYISTLLFEVAPLDPMTVVGGAGLIFGLALFSAYLPARRAMGVDPIEALRHE